MHAHTLALAAALLLQGPSFAQDAAPPAPAGAPSAAQARSPSSTAAALPVPAPAAAAPVLVSRSPSEPGPGWEKSSEAAGVVVYRKEFPGSPFRGIRGSGLVPAPPWKVALVLVDDARATEWVDSLDAAAVVNVVTPGEYVEYNHVSMPWPIADREFLTRVKLEHDARSGLTTITSEPEAQTRFPVRPKTIRGTLRGVYFLEPRDGGRSTYLTVELHSDPGGWLPGWLVNFFQGDWAESTIAGVRRQAAKADLVPPPPFEPFLSEVAGRPAAELK
jgi:START domain